MNRGIALLLLGAAALGVLPIAVQAQGYAREVVQPLPNPAQLRLSEALRTLAQDPHSVSALVAAGDASLGLEDLDAALGFFRRAEVIAPADGGVKAGLAAVATRQGQPIEALRLFAEAEAAGEPMQTHAAERGLAYDLAGDNARAQHEYGVSLSLAEDSVVVRRLALSQAIAGDQRASEATLLPLLQHSDLAAYRTRAFALAILGKSDDAVSIAETMLPERLSSRLAPYLRYMPRLTRAQQASAANLGIFPRAAEIGRDDPAIAAYAAQAAPAVAVRTADSRLVPSGAPLGDPARAGRGVPRRERPAGRDRVFAQAPQVAPSPQPTPVAVPAPAPAVAAAEPIPEPVESGPPAVVAAAPLQTVPSQDPPAAESTPPPVVAAAEPIPEPVASGPPAVVAAASPQTVAIQEPPAAEPTPPPVVVAAEPIPEPVASGPPAVVFAAQPQTVVDEEPLPAQTSSDEPLVAAPPDEFDLAEAFADFAQPNNANAPAEGAVDITAIQPRRETPRPPPAAVRVRPAEPSREWVQVATGRDLAALEFDWRRIKRNAGGLLDRYKPYVAAWGQTNRLVAGPFTSAREAQEFVSKLKDKQLDSFRFTSAQGQEIKPLE